MNSQKPNKNSDLESNPRDGGKSDLYWDLSQLKLFSVNGAKFCRLAIIISQKLSKMPLKHSPFRQVSWVLFPQT